METRDSLRRSLEARVDELDRKLDQIADRTAYDSADAETRLRSWLSDLRLRLNEARTRLREKEDADVRTEDAALAEIGRGINDMYNELVSQSR